MRVAINDERCEMSRLGTDVARLSDLEGVLEVDHDHDDDGGGGGGGSDAGDALNA